MGLGQQLLNTLDRGRYSRGLGSSVGFDNASSRPRSPSADADQRCRDLPPPARSHRDMPKPPDHMRSVPCPEQRPPDCRLRAWSWALAATRWTTRPLQGSAEGKPEGAARRRHTLPG
jgi:hypothetical protein